MPKLSGVKAYKHYWEDQAEFMGKEPWAKDKVLKIKILSKYEKQIQELGFSEHSFSNDNGKVIVKIKVPYNYFELDDIENKALKQLGIQQDWLIDVNLVVSRCSRLVGD